MHPFNKDCNRDALQIGRYDISAWVLFNIRTHGALLPMVVKRYNRFYGNDHLCITGLMTAPDAAHPWNDAEEATTCPARQGRS